MKNFHLYSEQESVKILQYLAEALRTFVHNAGYSQVVLGLSGGMDSALVLAIATYALGAEHVQAIFMPSPYTTDESTQCVHELVALFQNNLSIFPLNTLLDVYREEYSRALTYNVTGIALENIQSRLRATILMTHSNSKNALVLATSNKSELDVGFCTLYGDTCGAVAPLGGIYKSNVYMLAKYTSLVYSKTMPELLFTKAPSAELSPQQRDEDRLPPYPILDEILYAIEHNLSFSNIYEDNYIDEIQKLYQQATFKKRFYPPILDINIV